MVIHNDVIPPHRSEGSLHLRLVALEQQQPHSQRTIYTDPVRAARLLKTLIVTAVVSTAAALAFTFGYDLLQFLGRAALLALLVALIALVAELVLDTMKGPDA